MTDLMRFATIGVLVSLVFRPHSIRTLLRRYSTLALAATLENSRGLVIILTVRGCT